MEGFDYDQARKQLELAANSLDQLAPQLVRVDRGDLIAYANARTRLGVAFTQLADSRVEWTG